MKKTFISLLTPLAILCLPACKPKDPGSSPAPSAETTAPDGASTTPSSGTATKPAAEGTAAPATGSSAPAAAPVNPAERAAKLGFARHLPTDTQSMISIHNGVNAVNRVKNSGFVKIIGELSGNEEILMDDDLLEELDQEQDEELLEELDGEEPDAKRLLGKEITLAFGKGTDQQLKNLVTFSNRLNYYRFRELIKALAKSLASGEADGSLIESAMFSEALFTSFLADPQVGSTLLDALNMPPTYAAFLSSAEHKQADMETVSEGFAMMAMFGEMVEEVETSAGGNTFKGYKLAGKGVAAEMEKAKEDIVESLGEETFKKVVSAIAGKNLVILTGTVENYVVVFLGSSEDQLKLAPSPADSLAGSSQLAFMDPFLSKDLFTIIHGNTELISSVVSASGGFSVIADGVRDGLDEATELGDTRDIVALLQVVADKESSYLKMMQPSATGSVSYFEDGFKLESFGGIDAGAIEWDAENRLGTLGDGENVLLFANASTSAAFEKVIGEYYEAILESAYAIGMKVAEKGGEMEELREFNQGIMMFDKMFRSELVQIWKAFSVDMEEGLGRERAWVVDLNGSMPPIPGIPQGVVDKAKFPRITVVAPVADRAKLQSSWTTINESATKILKKVSEMSGKEIPMQKPMSSESNGVMTWFFSFPFFNDDFLPSVTLDEKWFTVATSKKSALDLVEKAKTSATKNKGAVLELDFKALHTFLSDMVPVLKENAEALKMSEDDVSKLSRIPDVISELDHLSIRTRKENGTVRTSIHFKTR